MDRKRNLSTNYHHRYIKEITNIMDTLEIVDIWRLQNPNLVRYTWRRHGGDLIKLVVLTTFLSLSLLYM